MVFSVSADGQIVKFIVLACTTNRLQGVCVCMCSERRDYPFPRAVQGAKGEYVGEGPNQAFLQRRRRSGWKSQGQSQVCNAGPLTIQSDETMQCQAFLIFIFKFWPSSRALEEATTR